MDERVDHGRRNQKSTNRPTAVIQLDNYSFFFFLFLKRSDSIFAGAYNRLADGIIHQWIRPSSLIAMGAIKTNFKENKNRLAAMSVVISDCPHQDRCLFLFPRKRRENETFPIIK